MNISARLHNLLHNHWCLISEILIKTKSEQTQFFMNQPGSFNVHGGKEPHLVLQPIAYLCICPASSSLPLYLTCQVCNLQLTFILDLQAEVCTALRVGHRDPIEPRCSVCGDVGHDDKARGPEHYGLVRPTDTLQSDAVWLRLGAATAVC